MPIVAIKGVGQVGFPDDMSADSIRQVLRSRFPVEQFAGLTGFSGTAGGAAQSVDDPFAREALRMREANREEALRNPNPQQQEPGIGQVIIPGLEDTPADIAFTAKAIQEGDALGVGIGAAGTLIPGLSAAKLGAVLPIIGKGAAKQVVEQGEKRFKVRTGGAEHKIDAEGRLFRFNKNREKWIDLTGTPGEANTLRELKRIEEHGGLEAFEAASEDRAKRLRESIDAERVLQDQTYKMQHQAPALSDGSGVSGVDVNDVMPDIYSFKGEQLYGTGLAYDKKALRVINAIKGKPDKTVTIYRAVPKHVKEINPGDWVSTTKEYATDHLGEEKNWHILSKRVKAKDIATDGNSIHEWGYDPATN